jgi:hypothetical protein
VKEVKLAMNIGVNRNGSPFTSAKMTYLAIDDRASVYHMGLIGSQQTLPLHMYTPFGFMKARLARTIGTTNRVMCT